MSELETESFIDDATEVVVETSEHYDDEDISNIEEMDEMSQDMCILEPETIVVIDEDVVTTEKSEKSTSNQNLPINCKNCGFQTTIKRAFSKHKCVGKTLHTMNCINCKVSDKKNSYKDYEKCPDCSYFTKKKASLKIHMRIHSGGTPYKCTDCSFTAKDLKSLSKHYSVMNNLVCECGYSTHVKQYMLNHKRNKHGTEKLICSICNFTTSDRVAISRHMRKHLED